MKRAALLLAGITACAGSAAPPPGPMRPPPGAPTLAPPAPAALADDSFRKQAPPADPEIKFVPPKIEEARLSNGMRLLLVERHELPVVALEIVVDRGASQTEPGIGGFAGAMLLQGTKTRSALELSDALEALGANYSTFVDYDAAVVRAQCLTTKLGALLPILAEVVQNPSFDPKEIERERVKRLTAIAQQKDTPSVLLTNAVGEALYPPQHAYNRPLLGDEPAVKRITRDKLARFHASLFKPQHMTVAMAGDISKAQALSELERVFGGFKSSGADGRNLPPNPPPPDAKQSRVVILDRPGAAQTNVGVALIGVPRSTPDFDTLTVMNTLFGGKFSSRLNLNLREKHAYTYGAGSGFAMRHGAGPFSAGGAIVTKATEPAVREIFAELERLRKEPVTETELSEAKTNLIQQLPARFETAADTASSLAALSVYGLPLDEYATRPARFSKVTRDDVQKAAAKYLVTERMRVVAVGDAQLIKVGLGRLGLGEPAVRKP